MRFSEWVIVGLMLFMPFAIGQEIELDRQAAAVIWRQNMDMIVDRACEDAVMALLSAETGAQVDYTDGMWHTGVENLSLNLEAASNRFRDTVYMGFGADTGTQVSKDALEYLMPVQMVVGEECLYVRAETEVRSPGGIRHMRIWKSGLPYASYDPVNRLVLGFTLTDYTWVYDETTGLWQSGSREELAQQYPGSLFAQPAAFRAKRKQVVTDLVRDTLTAELAQIESGNASVGVPVFNIPYEDGESWYNAIDGISFIGFLTGMNIPGTREVYTTSGFGGGRLALSGGYPVTAITGRLLVHRADCPHATGAIETFLTRQEAAAAGYAACPDCRP